MLTWFENSNIHSFQHKPIILFNSLKIDFYDSPTEPDYEKRLNDCYDECHKTDIMKELLGWSDSIKSVVLRAGR